jgi:hypothetical protein
MFVSGSADASSFANIQSQAASSWAGMSIGYNVYNSYSDAQTQEGNDYAALGGYANAGEVGSKSAGNVECGFMGPKTNGTVTSLTGYCGPVTAGEQVINNNNQPPPPVQATTSDLVGKLQTDLTAGNSLAIGAADEAEDILHKGIPGVLNPAATPTVTDRTSAPPTTGSVIDTTIPATPTTGATTPGAEAVNVATANLPSSGAITSTPPAAGTSSADAQQQPYTDPAYSGSLTTVPWATPSDFGARWNTFASGVQSTGLFGLWGNAFGSPGSGGGSTYTFNAGSLGTHTYDFSSWGSTVFGLLSGLVQIMCGFVAVKIATVKGG